MDFPVRLVTLVLVTPKGELLGSLEPFPVATPWWQDAWDVVRGAHEHHNLQVILLRLLEANRLSPHGGSVTYPAEVATRVHAEPWTGQLYYHPLRSPWAKPGGPTADLAWADTELTAQGIHRIGTPEQIRTWNLSSIWRLPVGTRNVWLKVVPSFFAHEGPLLESLRGQAVPTLIARQGGRMLLDQVPGEDLYKPPLQVLLDMITQLVHLQREWIGRTGELLALGLPDWRVTPLVAGIRRVMDSAKVALSGADQSALATFVDELDVRLSAISGCGIPDTLFHGDFHPGNHRGDRSSLILLDWGDSGVGHPLLDQTAFFDRVSTENIPFVRRHWHHEWQQAVPNSEPERASQLLAPIAAARQAVIYQNFLDHIEPSERRYHQADAANWLRRTAALARSSCLTKR